MCVCAYFARLAKTVRVVMKELILGGARSGKTRYAERCALASGKTPVYVATGWADDEEMAERIERHQTDRGDAWLLVEEPMHLAQALLAVDDPERVLVVDCLTLWLSNCMHMGDWPAARDRLLQVLPTLTADIHLVSNEVGSGIVPLGSLPRRFVDEAGWLHQALAQRCDQVTLVMAGLPLSLKTLSVPGGSS
jgi:adenosylcobinamide kinase/adenosylcobinamide-phosphate guanylyltransferase